MIPRTKAKFMLAGLAAAEKTSGGFEKDLEAPAGPGVTFGEETP